MNAQKCDLGVFNLSAAVLLLAFLALRWLSLANPPPGRSKLVPRFPTA